MTDKDMNRLIRDMDNLLDRSRIAMVVMRDIVQAANIKGETICSGVICDIDSLHELMIEQQRDDYRCEHGVSDGDWCDSCNKEYKRAARAAGLE
jgi:proline dehydrogenase